LSQTQIRYIFQQTSILTGADDHRSITSNRYNLKMIFPF